MTITSDATAYRAILDVNIAGLNVKTITAFLILVIVDYVTGVASAAKQHKLSSKVGWVGVMKKAGELLLIVASVAITELCVTSGFFAGETSHIEMIPLIITLLLALNESKSIIENLGEIGVKVPFANAFVKLANVAETNLEHKIDAMIPDEKGTEE